MSDEELLKLLDENDILVNGSEVGSGAIVVKIKEFQNKLESIENRISMLF